MNFLAHLFLSDDHPDIMVGNFIGDFVKGKNPRARFDPLIGLGIELHRSIDAYTDSHPIVKQSKGRLREKYRHYSGVVVDMFYDHFLAANWSQYHTQPLPEFAEQAYTILQEHHSILPPQVNEMLPYMIGGNWLVNYGKTEGLHRALSGMARRTPYTSHMDEAVADLEISYEAFHSEFSAFMPELQKFSSRFIEEDLLP